MVAASPTPFRRVRRTSPRRPGLRRVGRGSRATGGGTRGRIRLRRRLFVTGGTQAGMIAGFAQSNDPRTVIGIDGSAKPKRPGRRLRASPAPPRSSSASSATSRTRRSSSTTAFTRVPTASPISAHSRQCDLGLNGGDDHRPGLRGQIPRRLIHMVQDREIPPDANVLFAHLGGQPALNAYASLFSSRP